MSGPAGFVVMWRPGPAGRLEVQPHVYQEAAAAALARRLVKQYRGEAFTVPVSLPAEVSTD